MNTGPRVFLICKKKKNSSSMSQNLIATEYKFKTNKMYNILDFKVLLILKNMSGHRILSKLNENVKEFSFCIS